MRIVPKSTLRSLIARQQADTGKPATEHPTEERIQRATERQAVLSLVQGGCHYCCGTVDRAEHGKLACAVITNPQAPPAAKALAAKCPLPGLYEQVFAYQRLDLTVEEIKGLVPLAEVPDPAPAGPSPAPAADPAPAPPAPAAAP